MYPEVVQAIRQMTGSGVIMMPSAAVVFSGDETADYIEKTQR